MKAESRTRARVKAFLAGYLILATGYAVVQLLRGMDPMWSWVGLLLGAGAPLAGLLFHRGTARPALGYTVASGLGLSVTLALSYRFGPAAGWVHAWTGLALIGWFAWIRWQSDPKAAG